MNRCRLRVDVGGTFTDLVMIDFEGKIFYKKVPSTLRNRGVEVITGIQQILRHYSERYKDQFETALEVIRSEMEKGTERKAILDLLIERGFKTRTGKRWTYSILGNEQSRIRQGQT